MFLFNILNVLLNSRLFILFFCYDEQNSNITVSNGDQTVNVSNGVLKILVSQNQGFRVCHINAQNLFKKIDEFRDLFEGSEVDAVCVSETWFKKVNHKLYDLRGYKIHRVDRQDRVGGGVAIYVNESLKTKLNN